MSEGVHRPIGRLISASAGTGKTFSLTSALIALLAHHPEGDPARILATTFTRKAAGEILQRLLHRLAGAALDDRELRTLNESTELELSRTQSAALLAGLARRLHRLGVMTIDAYLMRLASVMQMGLGVAPGWSIVEEEDDAALREGSLRRTLESTDPDQLGRVIAALTERDASARVSASVREALDRAYGTWLKARAASPERTAAVWGWYTPSVEPLGREDIERATQDLISVSLPTNKKGDTHKLFISARRNAVDLAKKGRWKDLVKITLVKNSLTLGKNPSLPALYGGVAIPDDLRRACDTLGRHALGVLGRRLRDRNVAFNALMERFDEEYRSLKRRTGSYCFDDVPRLLQEGLRSVGTDQRPQDDLAYRLDARLDHILLDEFQDTSVAQFGLLRIWLDEIMAGCGAGDAERSVVVVGDPKQSLYLWRDAEPGIMMSLPDLWGERLRRERLDVSWRSSPIVLDAVNNVFGGLGSNGAFEAADQPRPDWSGLWGEHRAAPPVQRLPGRVRLIVGSPKGKEGNVQVQALRLAADRVDELLREARTAGVRASIGILFRSNRPMGRMLHLLRQKGITASLEGESALADTPGMAALISLFVLAEHPGDTLSAFHLANSPLSEALGLTDPTDLDTPARAAADFGRRALGLGFGPAVFDLVRAARPRLSRRDLERAEQAMELADDADRRGTRSLAEFRRVLEERSVGEPSPHAVRVMTIHRAKGLEFDAVILPQLDDSWSKSGDVLIQKTDPLSPADRATFAPHELLAQCDPALHDIARNAAVRRHSENLCLLYVAMTRARRALEMIVTPVSKSQSLSSASVLIGALAPGEKRKADLVLFEAASDSIWTDGLPPADADVMTAAEAPLHLELPTPARAPTWRLPRVSPSSLEGDTIDTSQAGTDADPGWSVPQARGLAAANVLGLPGGDPETWAGQPGGASRSLDGARLRGTVFHAWYERIGWLDDAGQPDDPELLEIARSLGAGEEGARRWAGEFAASLKGPTGAALRRAAYARRLAPDERLDLWRERRFIVRTRHPLDQTKDEVVLNGTFDRLVIGRGRDGRAAWAEVVDFKTDTLDADGDGEEALVQRAEHYRPQIEAYRLAAARILRVEQSRVSARLAFTALGREVCFNGA